jgi:hypothetical protein
MLRVYRPLKFGEIIIAGGDTSYGTDDSSVTQFYSATKFDVPMVWSEQVIASEMTTAIYPILEKIPGITGHKPVVAYERQNGGAFEMERLASLNRLGKYEVFEMPQYGVKEPGETRRLGWDTNSATRPEMLSTMKGIVDRNMITIYDKATIEEMFAFIVVRTSASVKAQAERNAHDDHVMALAIALKVAQLVLPNREKLLYDIEERRETEDDSEIVPISHFRRH